ncbi:TetR/AcrR family transcriptional regulator [Cryobacterium cheniae]|uniref:TetR/AcrR family transcriptional regulator n=2 Tax=Cryobacterium cheniae TaxID=1259262 RepID=A0A4R8XP63_9MICO|nr:TetR/AcrR family transcriptional regulator [Cryobacterium cheniae]
MRTEPRSPIADLNARAKIRDAAVVHFARDGFRKANLRAIAATAGVSAGLVIHHFGSKDALRLACDDHVLGSVLARARDKATPEGLASVLQNYLADPAEFQVQIDYLSRAIAEDSPAGRQVVDAIVDETEAVVRAGAFDGSMNAFSDPRAVAVLITMTSLSMMTMASHVGRALGFDGPNLSPAAMRRMALPSAELYTHGLYADDTVLRVTTDALAGSDATTPPNHPTQTQLIRKATT